MALLSLGAVVLVLLSHRSPGAPGSETAPSRSGSVATSVERCNGEDDDGDAEVDEECACRGKLVRDFPVVAFQPSAIDVTDDGELAAIESSGAAVFDGTTFRWVSGTDFERLRTHALVLEKGRLFRAGATPVPLAGAPERVEVFAGDARGWVAVTEDGAIHHGGPGPTRTSRLDVAAPDDLYIRRPDAVFAVDSAHRVSAWDGHTWSTLLERPGERLALVAGDATTLFVHGHDLTTDEHVVHRYDGRTWTTARFSPSNVPRDLVVAGGELYALAAFGTLTRFSGARYELVREAMFDPVVDLHGHSDASVFAAGGRCVSHYDGHAWTRIHCASGIGLRAVHAVADDVAFAVGPRDRGATVVLRCSQGACTELASIESSTGTAVWAANETSIYVGTEQGRIVHFDGTRWSVLHEAHRAVLALEGDGSVVYAALGGFDGTGGVRGGLLRAEGRVFRHEAVPTDEELRAIAILPDGRVAVGGGNDAYAETGSRLFVLEADHVGFLDIGEPAGIRALAALPNGFLSLASTREESDAGDHWGENTWSLRLHDGDGQHVLAHVDTQRGTALFATSPRNVFVADDAMNILHSCGPEPLPALP